MALPTGRQVFGPEHRGQTFRWSTSPQSENAIATMNPGQKDQKRSQQEMTFAANCCNSERPLWRNSGILLEEDEKSSADGRTTR